MNEGIEAALFAVVRGTRSPLSLRDEGLAVHIIEDRVEVEGFPGAPIVVAVEDVAQGLVTLARQFQDLKEWARFILGASNVVSFDEQFERSDEGDALLSAIWDSAFGVRPSGAALEAARRALKDQGS